MAHRTRRELDGRFIAVLGRQVSVPQAQFILLLDLADDSRVMMRTRTTPEGGYIVVRREARDGTVVYVLHSAPGPDQYLPPTCEAAAEHALTVGGAAQHLCTADDR